jgi:hypothetical protein
MEILNTYTEIEPDTFTGVIFVSFVAATLILSVYTIGSLINLEWRAAIGCALITSVLIIADIILFNHLPQRIYHEAVVTDYSVVYEQGLEIVEQRGKITVLKEGDDD